MTELPVERLRKVAAWLDVLPPRPWRAVELTDLEMHGPHPWDPDVEPSHDAHQRDESRRAEMAVWRGIVDADGAPLVGEPLAGGSAPRPVTSDVWRWVASSPTTASDLLELLRDLWRHQHRPPESSQPPRPHPPPQPARLEAADIEAAARAAYEAVPELTSWAGLPELVKDQWRARATAAISTALDR